MTLTEIIAELEKHPREQAVPVGFRDPHSYRGDYYELAFELVYDTTVGAMLDAARSAVGTTYCGYKGGEYTMQGYTQCWLAEYGYSGGETIGPVLLSFMLGHGGRVEGTDNEQGR